MDKDLLKSKIKTIKELTYTDIALEMLDNEELIVKMLEVLEDVKKELNYIVSVHNYATTKYTLNNVEQLIKELTEI